MSRYEIEVAYSTHDRGWYAEVFDNGTGKDVWQSEVCSSRDAAYRLAQWMIASKEQNQ